jgi:hypothetical protein
MTVLINSTTDQIGSVVEKTKQSSSPRASLVPFCIFGTRCAEKFCVGKLLNLDMTSINPGKIFTTLIICDKCYKDLYTEYKVFEGKVKALRSDFFEAYVAVKTCVKLNSIRETITKLSCSCDRSNCKVKFCGPKERDLIYRKFK